MRVAEVCGFVRVPPLAACGAGRCGRVLVWCGACVELALVLAVLAADGGVGAMRQLAACRAWRCQSVLGALRQVQQLLLLVVRRYVEFVVLFSLVFFVFVFL